MSSEPSSLGLFLSWFQSHNGFIDVSAMDIAMFPCYGRGAIALKDIPKGTTLAAIPRTLTLSTRSSELPRALGADVWKKFGLGKGWAGLILCMMWEDARGKESLWDGYLAILPETFDTPMFWGPEDLEELKGTAVVGKIGKEDAEKDYSSKLIPCIQSRPDLFPPSLIPQFYSLKQYHIMGSRILTRSFDVVKWESDKVESDDDGDGENVEGNTSINSGMDVDEDPATHPQHDAEEHTELEDSLVDDSEEEEEKDANVTMVPMADMLNARYGCENAKLFHEEHELKMITTKPIKAGEQIWNTYGDLPNSELLWRYGYVDLLHLPDNQEGNPGDVVEIPADLIVAAITQRDSSLTSELCTERIDWWLEEGGDDVFLLELDLVLPEAFVSLTRLLMLPLPEWEKVKEKGKPPKPKVDSNILAIAVDVFRKRLDEYPTSIEADETMLNSTKTGAALPLNKSHAIIVRLGEKRILHGALRKQEQMLAEAQKTVGNKLKRKENGDTKEPRTKKSRSS